MAYPTNLSFFPPLTIMVLHLLGPRTICNKIQKHLFPTQFCSKVHSTNTMYQHISIVDLHQFHIQMILYTFPSHSMANHFQFISLSSTPKTYQLFPTSSLPKSQNLSKKFFYQHQIFTLMKPRSPCLPIPHITLTRVSKHA